MDKKPPESRVDASRPESRETPSLRPEENEVEIIEIVGQEDGATATAPEGPATPGPDEAGPSDLPTEVETLRREKAEIQERLLRKHADLENMRKRLEREKEEFFQYAAASLVQKMLPVLDNLERALAVPDDAGGDGLREGLRLIHQQFREILEKEGLRSVEALGEKFDPTQHEAVLREETTEYEAEEVLEELQKGFFFRSRLLRPALVRVAVTPSSTSGGEDQGEESDKEEKAEPSDG